jgi:hypothetical protein
VANTGGRASRSSGRRLGVRRGLSLSLSRRGELREAIVLVGGCVLAQEHSRAPVSLGFVPFRCTISLRGSSKGEQCKLQLLERLRLLNDCTWKTALGLQRG